MFNLPTMFKPFTAFIFIYFLTGLPITYPEVSEVERGSLTSSSTQYWRQETIQVPNSLKKYKEDDDSQMRTMLGNAKGFYKMEVERIRTNTTQQGSLNTAPRIRETSFKKSDMFRGYDSIPSEMDKPHLRRKQKPSPWEFIVI